MSDNKAYQKWMDDPANKKHAKRLFNDSKVLMQIHLGAKIDELNKEINLLRAVYEYSELFFGDHDKKTKTIKTVEALLCAIVCVERFDEGEK